MSLIPVVSLLALATAFASAQGLQIEQVELPAAPEGAPDLKLVAEGNTSWTQGDPAWQTKSGNVSASGWFAQTRDGLLARVIVKDPEHNNEYHERNIWRGDCIYIAIDGRGDDTEENAHTNAMGMDDMLLIIGLGTEGPECNVSDHGDPSKRGMPGKEMLKALVRDEDAKTTAYDLRIPWESLNTAHGQSNRIGLAVTVAHKDADGNDQSWGAIRARTDRETGEVTPRQMNLFALDPGGEPFATISPIKLRLSGPDDEAQMLVTVKTADSAWIAMTLAPENLEKHRPIQPMAAAVLKEDDGIQRFLVSIPSDKIATDRDFAHVNVNTPSNDVVAYASFPLTTPDVVMARFQKHIEKLADNAPNDLYRRHLDSTLRVVRRSHEALALEREEHPERVDTFMNTVEKIQSLMPQEKPDWSVHVKQCVPLVSAFISERDHTLQFYYLQLPFDWDPEKAYPMTVYLHGAGANNPIQGLSAAFDNSGQDTLFRRVDIDPSNVPPTHRGFVVIPWARGNSYFKHGGEDDVWQSIQDVMRRFKIDEDRMYMSGFSMGCNGAWALAARTPDMWAGVNLASGFGSWSETSLDYLVGNMTGIPVKLWVGELDRMAEGAKEFVERVGDRLPIEAEFVPRVPHTYPYDAYQANISYLMQFKRELKPTFSFTADSQQHPGRRGVIMNVTRFPDRSQLPSFKCTVDGNEVRIISRNTPGLLVRLGEGGLELAGGVTLYLNGEKAYEGPAADVGLGENVPGYYRR